MSRLMSVAYTEQAVLERRKDVTRRLGWRFAEPDDQVTLCRKVMGRKAGEPLVRLVDVELVSVVREPLGRLVEDAEYGRVEMFREGFPGMDPVEFVDQYFVAAQGVSANEVVTRVEWRYLEVHAGPPVGEGTMPCCRRPVFEVPTWHRLTYDVDAVTCPGPLPARAQLQAVTR